MRKWRHGITVLGLRHSSTSLRISGRYPLAVDIEEKLTRSFHQPPELRRNRIHPMTIVLGPPLSRCSE